MDPPTYQIKKFSNYQIAKVANQLKKGGIAVIPTDTLYGIVGSALKKEVVEKIYQLRKRTSNKPVIILISSIEDLRLFNILLEKPTNFFLNAIWPNPVSVILDCPNKDLTYLHRGTNSLAFRIPKHRLIIQILKKSGPLIAPSANLQGENPATTIEQAKKYFSDNVNFYIDAGSINYPASTLLNFHQNKLTVLRQGEFKISQDLLDEVKRLT